MRKHHVLMVVPSRAVAEARAEALHVAGCFDAAAKAWEALLTASDATVEIRLKHVASLLAAGSTLEGERELDRIEDGAELAHLRAQHLWNSGRISAALQEMERSFTLFPSPDSATALATFLWRLRQREAAIRWLEEALHLDPDHPEALINVWNLMLHGEAPASPPAADGLQRAAAGAPERLEPHVLFARFHPDASEGEASLRAAHLRDPRRLRPSQAKSRATLSARVTGGLGANGLDLRLSLRWLGDSEPPSLEVSVGEGMGVSLSNIPGERVVRVVLTSRDEAGRPAVDLCVLGVPRGRGARFWPRGAELAAGSGWLPVFPGHTCKWEVELSSGSGTWFTSVSPDGGGVDALFLNARSPTHLAADGTAVWHAGVGAERVAALLRRAAALWEHVVGPAPIAPPPVVVVESTSTFAYSRAGFVRLPSRVAEDLGLAEILFHEAGHRWWGTGAAFTDDARWLEEGLAEYTLHLAEDAGLLPGHRRAARDAALEPQALSTLFSSNDPDEAAVARRKAASVLGMLRAILGEEGWQDVLRATLQAAQEAPVDTFTFAALCGRSHGASLAWFFTQWVGSPCLVDLEVGRWTVREVEGSWEIGCEVRSPRWPPPGVPLQIAFIGAHGQRALLLFHTCLARNWSSGRLPFRLSRAIADPDARLYGRIVLDPLTEVVL